MGEWIYDRVGESISVRDRRDFVTTLALAFLLLRLLVVYYYSVTVAQMRLLPLRLRVGVTAVL